MEETNTALSIIDNMIMELRQGRENLASARNTSSYPGSEFYVKRDELYTKLVILKQARERIRISELSL